MSRDLTTKHLKSKKSRGNFRQRNPDKDPEPPAAPPIIILGDNPESPHLSDQDPDPDSEPEPPVSPPTRSSKSNNRKVPDPEPDPDPEPEPEPAPPIIIFPKRPASSSPPESGMGSKISKISPNRPVTRSTSKADKDQLKEPPSRYPHRSKPIHRKATGGRDGAHV
ncbi:uncharacterized protein BDR25DRAFT_315564 [Lindgomyces ingoldianus]|uniref:Uncharacterized protein n=1 Tax=Lindgomyces ingoldianus TaxID=673940 RepID=A0ACB6QQ31_9PLEO|nr:uncharacterized protein BDR25DRAFT_315564 [Lindgomyces ingoldianus]KAF2469098.1 hypothetical protein BDR25DRAFT_315564 [Lindgomyces ingoldianus]